jgi:nitrate/nitrite transport system permease protein
MKIQRYFGEHIFPPLIGVGLFILVWSILAQSSEALPGPIKTWNSAVVLLNLSEWKVFTKILFPATLPYMLTGIRLAIGTAWLVIVAAEMLTGGVGIGFWVWDEWNNLNVEHIIIAIFIVGIVGLLLEMLLVRLAKRFSY